MASAIAGGIIKSGFISGDLVYAFDIDNSKLDAVNKTYGINGCTSEQELVNQVDIVIMAVKPNIVESVINKIKENLHNKAMISIVAGYNNDRYNELLLPSSRHLTVMPNTPALVLKGMTLLEKENSLSDELFCSLKNELREVDAQISVHSKKLLELIDQKKELSSN